METKSTPIERRKSYSSAERPSAGMRSWMYIFLRTVGPPARQPPPNLMHRRKNRMQSAISDARAVAVGSQSSSACSLLVSVL